MMDTELAKLTLKRIEADLSLFDMKVYVHQTECGTKACIAGHAMLAAGYSYDAPFFHFTRPDGSAVIFGTEGREAMSLLRLTGEEYRGSALQYGSHPVPLFSEHQDQDAALERFRKLIKTCEEMDDQGSQGAQEG
jgi:hypothetical protein